VLLPLPTTVIIIIIIIIIIITTTTTTITITTFCSVTIRRSSEAMNTSINWMESADIFERKMEGGREGGKEEAKEQWRKLIMRRFISCTLQEIF
jgi:hypothetical protein